MPVALPQCAMHDDVHVGVCARAPQVTGQGGHLNTPARAEQGESAINSVYPSLEQFLRLRTGCDEQFLEQVTKTQFWMVCQVTISTSVDGESHHSFQALSWYLTERNIAVKA